MYDILSYILSQIVTKYLINVPESVYIYMYVYVKIHMHAYMTWSLKAFFINGVAIEFHQLVNYPCVWI